MSLRLAVIGKTGQLARALLREGEGRGHQIIALDREALDLASSPAEIDATITALPSGLDGLIIAAAYTAVDSAETQSDLAFAINSTAPAAIAKACAKHDIPLVHISTDYVFDGKASQPYSPDDDTDPLGIYGASKLDGETAVIGSGARAVILRTSWVYDGTGSNFLTTMLRLAKTRDTLSVVDDQFGRPTYAGHLAEAILRTSEMLSEDPDLQTGVYHVTNSGEETSWAGFAKTIFQASNIDIAVDEIPTSDYPTPAERPAYSALDTSSFERVFHHPLPDWKAGLRAALDEYQAAQEDA